MLLTAVPFSVTKPTSRLAAAANRSRSYTKLAEAVTQLPLISTQYAQAGYISAVHSPTVICIEEASSALVDVRRPKSAGSQGESGLGDTHAGQGGEVDRCPQARGTGSAGLQRHNGTERMPRPACCSVRQGFGQAALALWDGNNTVMAPSTVVEGT